jgi:hypothetical protein
LSTNFNNVLERATPAAQLEVRKLLASPRFVDSPSLTAAALGELSRTITLDQAGALKAAATLTATNVGAGLTKIDTSTNVAAAPAALQAIANASDWKDWMAPRRPRQLQTCRASLPRSLARTWCSRMCPSPELLRGSVALLLLVWAAR